jgi:uracil-DNA glycosylase
MSYGTRVLTFVVEHMPALERIVCLGQESWECATAALGLSGDWQQHRDSGSRLGPLVAAFHPAARVSTVRIEAAWRALDLR